MDPLRKIRHNYLKKKKLKQVKEIGTITAEQLEKDFRDLGIKEGEILFVHSAMSKIGFVEGGPKTIIDVLMKIIGPEGTLAFPTFTFPGGGVYGSISNPDYIFDPDQQPSQVGKITEVFRKMEGVYRSSHPTHSMAVWGKDAEEITREHIEISQNWGPRTPFGKLIDRDATIIAIGVSIAMFTFFHCVEDYYTELYPGLYHKDKMKIRIRKNGVESEYEMGYHDPETYIDRIEKNPAIESYYQDYFENSGVMKIGKIGNATTLHIKSSDVLKHGHELAKNGKTVYKI